jgi:hypothetical protein
MLMDVQKNRSSNDKETSMSDLGNWMNVFGGLSGGTLAVLVVLAAFGLAAFAIYAVLTLAKDRR